MKALTDTELRAKLPSEPYDNTANVGSFKLLEWQIVTAVTDDRITLANGLTLRIVDNKGCGGCDNGWSRHKWQQGYKRLVGKVITNVKIETLGEAGYDNHRYLVHFFGSNSQIAQLDVDMNWGNGYYGAGVWLQVARSETDHE